MCPTMRLQRDLPAGFASVGSTTSSDGASVLATIAGAVTGAGEESGAGRGRAGFGAKGEGRSTGGAAAIADSPVRMLSVRVPSVLTTSIRKVTFAVSGRYESRPDCSSPGSRLIWL